MRPPLVQVADIERAVDPIPLTAVLVGALLGAYAGAHLARRLPAPLLRGIVLTTAVTMTVLYFRRG